MMITKRQFSVMLVIFLTLLLLFMGFQLGKEAVSSPELNKHIADISTNGKSIAFTPRFVELNKSGTPDGLSAQDEWILYIGNENSEYSATVKEWSYYTGTPVALSKALPADTAEELPDIIMIEPEFAQGQAENIARLMNKGCDIIFLSIPDYDYITSDYLMRKILGIRKALQQEIELKGIHLFKGFLLGGERIFEEDTEEAENEPEDDKIKLQDLDLNVPWYSVRTGTKTYMRGTLTDEDSKAAEENKLKNEDMPAIIWKSHYGSADAFAVNGEYLKNLRAGIGMLQAMMYERKQYAVYPVINAQVFSVDCFPFFTDENQQQVEKIYGRSVTKAQTDIIMPMFITLSAKYDKKPSCFLSVKYDRNDPAQPQRGIISSYLSMIDEMGGELSVSANHRESGFDGEELSSDFDYLDSEASEYRISAIMSSSRELPALTEALKASYAKDIRTVTVSDYSPSLPIVGQLNEDTTLQQTTSDLMRHTFTDELNYLGVQTLLAYSNDCCNMANSFYPRTKKEEWQNSSRDIFSNLTTYSYPFRAEDCLTVTESDARVRTYFSLDYNAERSGDTVTVTSDRGGCYFILRTHNEYISSVSGGKFTKIEENAYLISAEKEKTVIKLGSSLSDLVDMEGSNR